MINYYGFNNPQPTDERIWVANQTSAEAYLVAPNGFVRLWDNSTNKFYEKRADASGRPYPMDIFEYKQINQHKCNCSDYSHEFEDINSRLAEIERRLGDESDGFNADGATTQPV